MNIDIFQQFSQEPPSPQLLFHPIARKACSIFTSLSRPLTPPPEETVALDLLATLAVERASLKRQLDFQRIRVKKRREQHKVPFYRRSTKIKKLREDARFAFLVMKQAALDGDSQVCRRVLPDGCKSNGPIALLLMAAINRMEAKK